MIDIEQYIADHITGKTAEQIAAEIYADGTGEAESYNEAVRGPDVKDGIVKMNLLLKGYFDAVGSDASDAAQAAQDAADDAETTVEQVTGDIETLVKYKPTDGDAVDNAYNLLLIHGANGTSTNGGVTFTWTGTGYQLTGSTSSGALKTLVSSSSAVPNWITPGGTLRVGINAEYGGDATDHKVYYQLRFYNGAEYTQKNAYVSQTIDVPEEITGIVVRLYVVSGTNCGTEESPTVFDGGVYGAPSNAELDAKITALDTRAFRLDGVTVTNTKAEGITKSWSFDVPDTGRPYIVTCLAKYTGDEEPNIRFVVAAYYDATTRFRIGGKNHFLTRQWRLPPMYPWSKTIQMRLYVPVGGSVEIKALAVSEDTGSAKAFGGIRFNAHQGISLTAPSDSIESVTAAVQCHYDGCVITPKRSSDGVWFAYHDDTLKTATANIRDENGELLSVNYNQYNNMDFSEIPYDEVIEKWDFGRYKNANFAGTPAMLIEDYFRICAETGLKPAFSMHPYNTTEDLSEIREMLERYGLLGRFTFKGGLVDGYSTQYIDRAVAAFGDDIESYVLDVPQTVADPTVAIAAFNAVTGIDRTKVRCTIGLAANKALSADGAGWIAAIRAAGYECEVFELTHTYADGTTGTALTGEEFERLISLGVTEFTDRYNLSNGLRW